MRRLLLALALLLCTALPSQAAVSWVKVVSQGGSISNLSFTFTGTATTTGDAIVFFLSAAGNANASLAAVTLTAPGWTITNIVPFFGQAATTGYGAAFGAIALNTSLTTFTVTWSGGAATSLQFQETLVDEFTGNDQTGSTTTFDAHNSNFSAASYADLSVTPANNDDGVWFGLSDNMTGANSPYTIGAVDGFGDGTEWKILSGNSGVAQTSSWAGGAKGAYLQAGITIKPAAGASGGGGFGGKGGMGGKGGFGLIRPRMVAYKC